MPTQLIQCRMCQEWVGPLVTYTLTDGDRYIQVCSECYDKLPIVGIEEAQS